MVKTKTKNKTSVLVFLKKEFVLMFVSLIAIVSCFFVPIDYQYLNYFEWNTLICLFSILIVVAGLKNTQVFNFISRIIIKKIKTRRVAILVLVFGTFFFDMIVANDMSLITFLPLTYLVLRESGNIKYLGITFVLQTIAANMGGMITPYGNPQNLYLYSFFNIDAIEFFKILLPFSLIVVVLLCLLCFVFIKNAPLKLKSRSIVMLDKKKLLLYGILFVLTILGIFRIVNYLIVFILTILLVLIFDKQRFKEVDYGLLMTFVVFFILTGNLARIPGIESMVTNLINKDVFLTGVLSSQIISNVPTSILLSKFTTDYRSLLIAVNISSLGIPIASLASLITIKNYQNYYPGHLLKYLGIYIAFSLIFVGSLVGAYYFFVV